MPVNVDAVIQQIREDFPNVQGIYLFGSEATRQTSSESDLDLALLLPRPAESVKLWDCGQKIASLAGRDVDLLDLRSASTVMQVQVIDKGKRILTQDARACNEFEMLALSMYLRLNEERAGIIEAIRKDGRVFG